MESLPLKHFPSQQRESGLPRASALEDRKERSGRISTRWMEGEQRALGFGGTKN